MYNQIKLDLINAQKSGNAFLVGVLKLVLSELSYLQVELKGAEMTDEMVVKTLFKEAKKRKDSIEAYTKANRPELSAVEEKELKIIETYLPVLMGEEEARSEIARIATETGFAGGRLMGAVMNQLKGKIDGSLVQKLVNEGFVS